MQTQSNKIDFKGQNIYAGFDVHLKSWKVTIMTEKLTHKTFSQEPKPEVLYNYLLKNFPGGTYYSAYEAGFCGYWIHNKLLELGIKSIVVNPADIPTTGKEKVMKTDPRDSNKIARSLRSGDLQPIYVPSTRTLEERGLVREGIKGVGTLNYPFLLICSSKSILRIVMERPLSEIIPSALNFKRTRVALSLETPMRSASSCREIGSVNLPAS